MKSLIYVANNCYKSSSLTFTMEWVLWKIDSFEVFDLQGAHLLLEVLIPEVRVQKYHGNSEIMKEIHQD